MESIINSKITSNMRSHTSHKPTNLSEADINFTYTINAIVAEDAELKSFLFTLGCYEGEQVTVISKLAENFVISVKDARYSIDQELAEAILI